MFIILYHSHKKRKHWPYCCYLCLNLKYLGQLTETKSKQQKMVALVRNCSVKMKWRLFQPLSVVMTMVPTLLRQLRRLLQMKKIITNVLCVLQYAEQSKYINQQKRKKVGYLLIRTPLAQLKMLQKLHRKRSNDCSMVSFTHNGTEITAWMGCSLKTKNAKFKAKQHF